jgi:hypothetical protein
MLLPPEAGRGEGRTITRKSMRDLAENVKRGSLEIIALFGA